MDAQGLARTLDRVLTFTITLTCVVGALALSCYALSVVFR